MCITDFHAHRKYIEWLASDREWEEGDYIATTTAGRTLFNSIRERAEAIGSAIDYAQRVTNEAERAFWRRRLWGVDEANDAEALAAFNRTCDERGLGPAKDVVFVLDGRQHIRGDEHTCCGGTVFRYCPNCTTDPPGLSRGAHLHKRANGDHYCEHCEWSGSALTYDQWCATRPV